MQSPKVVIVGAGFGGVAAAQSISQNCSCEITLIDRRNFHLFQPLLYQVAMAGLNPADIAIPLRTLFRKRKNVQIILAEVDQLDLPNCRIHFDQKWLEYDYLVLSCGAKHFYFDHDDWETVAPGLKTIEQATEVRRRILTAFELAEKESQPAARAALLTFVVIGGGPTGVELAGAIAEMASHTLYKDYHHADLKKTRVILIEAGSRLLAAFPEKLSQNALQDLKKLGVEVVLNTRTGDLSTKGLKVGEKYVEAHTILWAAGVKPSSLTAQVLTSKENNGRVQVKEDLSTGTFPNVFVIGDQSACKDFSGKNLPGIAPVAIQQGHFLGSVIRADIRGQLRPKFNYVDKGIMATIGRSKAVAYSMGLNFTGLLAWLIWVFVHIIYLMRFKNRFFVFLQWMWSYFTFGRGARLITHKTWRFYGGEKIKIE